MAVPPLRALVGAGHDVALVVTRVDKRRGRGSGAVAQPREGGGARVGPRGLPRRRRRDPARRRPSTRRGRGVRADHQAARARRRSDGQPALLAAAAVAWSGAGGAGAPRRRRDDRRVRDGGRGGPRHRRRVRPRRGAIGPETTAADLRTELVDVGSRLLVETLAAPVDEWIDDPEPQPASRRMRPSSPRRTSRSTGPRPVADIASSDSRRRGLDDIPRQAPQDPRA